VDTRIFHSSGFSLTEGSLKVFREMPCLKTAPLTLSAKILLSKSMSKGTAKNKAYMPLGVKREMKPIT
jgi:hypothetical protein